MASGNPVAAPARRPHIVPCFWILALAALTSCDGGDAQGAGPGGDARLVRVDFGRLADVYGEAAGGGIAAVERDVLLAPEAEVVAANDAAYRILRPDPDTLQPRILIRQPAGSASWRRALERLERGTRTVTPGHYGQDTSVEPLSLVPRNAAIRLTFSEPLGIDESFFVAHDEHGRVTGVKNTEAVQLLRIVDDPNDGDHARDFAPIAVRITVRERALVLDPVLLGHEGRTYGQRNSPTGLPESGDSHTANIRIALALAGPLRIPGLREDDAKAQTGRNLGGTASIIRDFRSGNRGDDGAILAHGFLRDATPPRLVGEITTWLEAVEPAGDGRRVLTLWKGGVEHELDLGDALRVIPRAGTPLRTEIVVEPSDDLGAPAVQRVRAVVDAVAGLDELDPRRLSGYPSDPGARGPWLRANAPRVIVNTEFTRSRSHGGAVYGDDPRWFVHFAPEPADGGNVAEPTDLVSPHAGVVVRFSKPMDATSVDGTATLFIATRDVLDPQGIEEFRSARGISAGEFNYAKFVTPHLVAGRVTDFDGSQSSFSVRPPLGMYLDERMRAADDGVPFADKRFRYFLHLVAHQGLRDLSGNALDLDDRENIGADALVVPFALDTRKHLDGTPRFADNLVASVVRRLDDDDEDERPSYYRPEEVDPTDPRSLPDPDLFGAVFAVHGRLQPRTTTRATAIVDSIGQATPPDPNGPLAWYPRRIRDPDGFWGFEGSQATPSAAARFTSPVLTPWNPYGARLQTVWREIDMNLSRFDPLDFDLDVERLLWAPFQDEQPSYDHFDSASLFLGHAEYRPEPAVGTLSSLATLRESGVKSDFAGNYLHNLGLDGSRESGPAPHAGFRDRPFTFEPGQITRAATGSRFLPLPALEEPYFVWRDQTVTEQGGSTDYSKDTGRPVPQRDYDPYLLSPFLGGRGTDLRVVNGTLERLPTTWNNLGNWDIGNPSLRDVRTGGGVGAIALPLLLDLHVYPDDPALPANFPFLAAGINGTQISLSVTSKPFPNSPWAPPMFRAYSAGYRDGGSEVRIEPGTPAWAKAAGGWDPINKVRTFWGDNSVYWIMVDFLKRRCVATSGFVDLLDPHRMPAGTPDDPRLGPFDHAAGLVPWVTADVVRAQGRDGSGEVRVEYRAAAEVDPDAWRAAVEGWTPPDAGNFANDPRKAGDAHVRKYDGASGSWRYLYNRRITDYASEPNVLFQPGYLRPFGFSGAAEVRYLNWRLLFVNGDGGAAELESFALSYRFQR